MKKDYISRLMSIQKNMQRRSTYFPNHKSQCVRYIFQKKRWMFVLKFVHSGLQ